MYKVITDSREKKRLLGTYSHNIKISSLKAFERKSGYGDDFIAITFKEEMEPEWEWEKELTEIKDNQVLLTAGYPATISDNKAAEENVYLDFAEFYDYLAEVVKERIEESPEDKAEYEELLEKVKVALEV